MKLVDILARELEEWPEDCRRITQRANGDLVASAGFGYQRTLAYLSVDAASDRVSAVVTRQHWQAARAAYLASIQPERDAEISKIVESALQTQQGGTHYKDLKIQPIEYTGGSVSYYKIKVARPTSPSAQPYIAECNDIIEALDMNYAEGNAFKAIWRMCAARKGLSKRGYTDGCYDAEKVIFFGERMLIQQRALVGGTNKEED